ncbi:unnamed protein product [Heterobilharzia americana]|nr:unnamed protein product [Heterobilharzia americana]
MFSFKALNCSERPSLCDLDSSNNSSSNGREHGVPCLLEITSKQTNSYDLQKVNCKNTVISSTCKSLNLNEVSPNAASLLKPTKTRESEEVRITKLYHLALRLCSSDCPDEEFGARPILESILNSFIIESNKLTPQLASVKFASCKLLGGIYFKLNKDAEGIDLLNKALQLDSNDLSLWIRLARAAIRSGSFEVAISSIDHILTKRPSHPLALHLALPLYFAVSELEICLELSTRMLQIDPSSEYAVYFINRILTIQPSLHEMVQDLFLQRPDILSQLPSCEEAERVDREVQKIRLIYRKQKDAEVESQIIPFVKFPSPLKHLSWLHLIEQTVAMYDRLHMESSIHVVLDLSSLLYKELLNETSEVLSHPTNTHSNCKLTEKSNDAINQIENSNIHKVSNSDTVCELLKDDFNDFNMETSSDDLAAGLEKRRSARVRTCFDLSDGLNRYCSRRSVITEMEKVSEKCKPLSEKVNNAQKENNNPNDRFKLADRFQTLLPQIFRDLGLYNRKQKTIHEVNSSVENLVAEATSSGKVVSVHSETVPSKQSDLWSAKSVHSFLILLNSMKPNVVTFGISLLLQTSRLTGCRWSSELATAYLNLFSRLQPSFPYILTIPPSHSSSEALGDHVREKTVDSETCLLPEYVLALKVPPELNHLSDFYIIYIELYFEELESNHNSTESTAKNSQSIESSTSLLSVLNEILSRFEETSSDYPIIMSHLLWVDYLMCSHRQDYAEMKECVLALKKHLSEHKLVVTRPYSVHHGDLTLDYMNHLLSKLKNVSSFDRLIQLSNEGQHVYVVLELMKTFQLQRATNSILSSSYSSSDSSDHSHSIIKQLRLCYSSLKYLITNIQSNDYKPPAAENSTTEVSSNDDVDDEDDNNNSMDEVPYPSIQSLYCYCVVLIEECLILLSGTSQDQVMSEESVDIVGSIAMKTVKLLNKCWILLGDNYVNEDNCHTSQYSMKYCNSSSDISLFADLPIKLLGCHDDGDDDKRKSSNCQSNLVKDDTIVTVVNTNKSALLSISDACRTVTVIVDLLICIIRISIKLLSNWTSDFYLQLVSLLYEHLSCIEQSIPCSALPMELRIYRYGAELTEDLSLELKLNAYCGSASAPPSIACLHLFHEFSILLFTYNQLSTTNNPVCRDYPEIVKLLVQLVIRSSSELQSISARFYSPDLRWYLETNSRVDNIDGNVMTGRSDYSSTLQTNEEYTTPVSPDDNTVACRDDLQNTISKCWPKDCICLAQVLSCSMKCLLGNCLTREITTFYQPTEKYLSLDFLESSEFMKIYNCIKTKYGDGYTNFIPEWINTVKNLFDFCDVFNHHHHQQQLQTTLNNKPNWWNLSVDGNNWQQEFLDWECVKIIFLFACPSPFPEYDSIKTLSISNEMLKFLCDTTKIMSTFEHEKMLPKCQIDSLLQSKTKDIQLPSVPKGLSFLTKSMYYLIADNYMKNNHFDRAVEYYLQDLRVSPHRADTWASLGLIYSSELEQVLNLTNLKTERVSAEAVSRCLRCFNVALHLQPDTVTLLIERGCLAYQLHSYAARIVKKSEYRNFPDVHLNLCRKWRHRMLQLSRSSYESVLNLCSSAKQQRLETTEEERKATASTVAEEVAQISDKLQRKIQSSRLIENDITDNKSNPDNRIAQSKEEEWLCHYMLAKCAEKDAHLIKQSEDVYPSSRLMHVLRLYHGALKALDAAGAKYPKKIIVYNKLPFRAVEAIEVYYRIHALSLKSLLKYGPPSGHTSQSDRSAYPINLTELDQFLAMIDTSDFVTSARKPCRRTRKRTANMAGLSTKQSQPQKLIDQVELFENGDKPTGVNESSEVIKPIDTIEKVSDKSSQPPNICLISSNLNTISSQDEFIDLTSPDPNVEEEESPEPLSNIFTDKLVLWKKCVDRCRCALELVLQRLPLHYKAMYQLASLYLHAPHLKDSNKALDILLGPTEEPCKPLSTTNAGNNNTTNITTTSASNQSNIGGLFKDRKQNNFFYGVWRIPTADIDRSGNFAAHMYRSVSLTLSLLHDRGDWKRLVHIFHQLRKQPPEEKRGFLGEGDRVFLARRAFSLIQPTLFNWLTKLSLNLAHKITEQISKDHSFAFNSDISSMVSDGFLTVETLTQIYRLHCVSFSRNSSSGVLNTSTSSSLNSSLCSPTATCPTNTVADTSSCPSNTPGAANVTAAETSGYASVLQLAYRLCPAVWDSRGPLVPLDWVLERCSELAATKSLIGISDSSSTMNKT